MQPPDELQRQFDGATPMVYELASKRAAEEAESHRMGGRASLTWAKKAILSEGDEIALMWRAVKRREVCQHSRQHQPHSHLHRCAR